MKQAQEQVIGGDRAGSFASCLDAYKHRDQSTVHNNTHTPPVLNCSSSGGRNSSSSCRYRDSSRCCEGSAHSSSSRDSSRCCEGSAHMHHGAHDGAELEAEVAAGAGPGHPTVPTVSGQRTSDLNYSTHSFCCSGNAASVSARETALVGADGADGQSAPWPGGQYSSASAGVAGAVGAEDFGGTGLAGDVELQALLLAWYHSGYATGRYRALQEVQPGPGPYHAEHGMGRAAVHCPCCRCSCSQCCGQDGL